MGMNNKAVKSVKVRKQVDIFIEINESSKIFKEFIADVQDEKENLIEKAEEKKPEENSKEEKPEEKKPEEKKPEEIPEVKKEEKEIPKEEIQENLERKISDFEKNRQPELSV